MKLNLRLRYEREARGWSQARIADEVGTTDRNVSRWERGETLPSPYFRERLCTLFGKSAAELGLVASEQIDSSGADASIQRQTDTTGKTTSPANILFDPALPSLPNEDAGLVGRNDLLHLLRTRLCSGKNTALYGLPGVGKTALVLALAYDEQVLATFSDGVLWAGLGPRPQISGQLSRWGTLLGLSSIEEMAHASKINSTDAWALALHTAIGKRRLLIVLDDAWDIESSLLFNVGGSNCALLVTTRFPRIALRFAGEGAIAIHELERVDGLALLKRLAPETVEHDSTTAQALVQEVGGLPLALTLMGKYLQAQTYDGQPRRMRTALERLRDAQQRLLLDEPQSPIDRPPYFTESTRLSIYTVIAESDRQMDEQARSTLRALSIFPPKPNSFSEEAAVAISQSPVEVLDTLSDFGLLESSGPGRYTLHQVVADYARIHLTETTVGERLVAYMVTYVETYQCDYEALERESRNILAALTQAFVSGQQARLVRGVHAFAPFLLDRSLYDLARLHLQRAYQIALWQHDMPAITLTLLHLGCVALQQGEYGQAEAYLRDGLAGAREIQHEEYITRLLIALDTLALRRGEAASR